MPSSTLPHPTQVHVHLPASSWLRTALRRVVQVPGPGPMTGAWGGGAACRLSLGTCCKRRSGSRRFPNGRALPGLRFPQSPRCSRSFGLCLVEAPPRSASAQAAAALEPTPKLFPAGSARRRSGAPPESHPQIGLGRASESSAILSPLRVEEN